MSAAPTTQPLTAVARPPRSPRLQAVRAALVAVAALALAVTVLPAASPAGAATSARFSISLSTARVVVAQGSEGRVAVRVTRRATFRTPVILGLRPKPSGVSTAFTPNPATTRADLVVRVAPGTPVGTRTTNVIGTAAGRSVSVRLLVTVVAGNAAPAPTTTPAAPTTPPAPTAPPTAPTVPATTSPIPTLPSSPDVTMQVTPSSVKVPLNAVATYAITLTRTGGFTAPVQIGVENLPPGTGWSVTPNPVDQQATLRIVTTSATPVGNYPVTIRSGASRTTTVELRVGADFSLVTGNLSQRIVPGATATYPVAISPTNGFDSPVSLSATGLPAGVTPRFSQNPATSGAVLSLDTTASVALGSYPVTVVGSALGVERTAKVTLVVGPKPAEFTVTPSAAILTAAPGATASTNLAVQLPANGGPLVLTSIGWRATNLPSGVKATFTPIAGTASTRLDLATSTSTPVGAKAIHVSASYGNSRTTVDVVLAVTGSGATQPFSLALNPPVLFAVPGGAQAAAIAMTDNGGSSDPVLFAVPNLPSGVTAGFNPNPSATGTTMTLAASGSAKKGTYSLAVVAIRGTVVRLLPVTFTVV